MASVSTPPVPVCSVPLLSDSVLSGSSYLSSRVFPPLLAGAACSPSLVTHLARLLSHTPSVSVADVERVSLALKSEDERMAQSLCAVTKGEVGSNPSASAATPHTNAPAVRKIIKANQSIINTLSVPTASVRGVAPSHGLTVPDVVSQLASYRDVFGVSFLSGVDALKLQTKISALVCEKSLGYAFDNASLWGKVFGVERDYIVLEVRIDRHAIPEGLLEYFKRTQTCAPGTDASRQRVDPLGVGLNEHIYLVCNDLDRSWYILPLASPEVIRAARCVHKLLTGKVDAAVKGFPLFPYTEAHLLRANIARISHATHIAPKGKYFVQEKNSPPTPSAGADSGEEGDAYETIATDTAYIPLSSEEIADIANWSHIKKHIKSRGNTEPSVPVQDSELNDSAVGEEEEEEDSLPLLSSIDMDSVGREYGLSDNATGVYRVRTAERSLSHPRQSVLVQSVTWPGACAAAFAGGATHNLYIGWANKYTTIPFAPHRPNRIAKEYQAVQTAQEQDKLNNEHDKQTHDADDEDEEDDEDEDENADGESDGDQEGGDGGDGDAEDTLAEQSDPVPPLVSSDSLGSLHTDDGEEGEDDEEDLDEDEQGEEEDDEQDDENN